MKKTKVNKPAYLGISILGISKTLMYEFWYDCIKPKYQDKAKLCYMNTGSFIIYTETEDSYEDISKDVEKWFDISNYDDKRPLLIGKNKKVIGLFKDDLRGKTMKEFAGHRAKIYAYLMDDDTEHKKPKGRRKCVIKRRVTFKNYADCSFNNKIKLKSQRRFKSDYHNVYTEQINKIALSSKDDKRSQTFDKIATYPYESNAFKVCESDMLSKCK